MRHEQVVELLESKKWTFAKTMPQWPHEWSPRKDWDNDVFENVCHFINKFGVERKWGKRTFRYFQANGLEYWVIGPVENAGIINRAKIKK